MMGEEKMPLVVDQKTGEVVHMHRCTPDVVPSRREVETAFIRLRAKHGLSSGHEIETLWRAIARLMPLNNAPMENSNG